MLFLQGLSWIGFICLLGVVGVFVGFMTGFVPIIILGGLAAVLFVPAVVVWAIVSFVIDLSTERKN